MRPAVAAVGKHVQQVADADEQEDAGITFEHLGMTEGLKFVKIWWSISCTVFIDSARNISHPKQTRLKVKKMPGIRQNHRISAPVALEPGTTLSQSLCRASAMPCSAPQRMKRTAAPCHRPPSSMVTSRLK